MSFINLAVVASSLLGHTFAPKDIHHSIVSFVTGVFIDLSGHLGHRDNRSDLIGKRSWIIDCEFIVNRVLGRAGKPLGQHHVIVSSRAAERLPIPVEISRLHDQRIPLPPTSGVS